ncbi:uncharacterized protein LOC119432879 isoform X2 [Dermacentor silvarum]|uniref:uncharacterized protein LOC119432879 isoform X2 n=1 Tax=Dermacentor silvarum TaxID=543639 RepID=UPI002100A70D|nr:uncharacterized protein LOC119432879 isoform X2 [Dermacentor silvarum]
MFMTFPTIQRREHFGEPRLLHDVQAQGQVPDQVRNGHQQAGVNLRKRPGCEAGVLFSSRFPCESWSHQTSAYRQLKQVSAAVFFTFDGRLAECVYYRTVTHEHGQ